ncbi:unnamed protein product, partial [Hapterophycus canaliculatus]
MHLFRAGFDISLSMGPVLNASFRANEFSLQALFCALADETPVVRALSEWFSLCLVLLLHPADHSDQKQRRRCPALSSSYGRESLSPASSTCTAPVTPASSASTTHATPASTSPSPHPPALFAPDAPSTATIATPSPRYDSQHEGGSNSSSQKRRQRHGKAPGGSGGGGGGAGSHGRFSRATILALGSVVLARRLARARGPCLPRRVQAMLGLADSHGDAFELVGEGIRSARQAFRTELEARHDHLGGGERGECREVGGGDSSTTSDKGILAGEVVFERRVLGSKKEGAAGTSSTASRTLLEWVTDGEDGGRRSLPPDFVQGVQLSSVRASGPAAPSPGRGDSTEGKSPAGKGGLSPSFGKSHSGDTAMDEGQEDEDEDEDEEGNGFSDDGCLSDAEAPSSAFSWLASSTSNSDSDSTPPLPTPSSSNDDRVSPPQPPPSSSPSSLSTSAKRAKRPARVEEACGPCVDSGGANVFSNAQQRRRGKRRKVAPQDPKTGRAATERTANTKAGTSSARARALPAPRAGPVPSPEEQKNARWEVLLQRVLAALDDRCG